VFISLTEEPQMTMVYVWIIDLRSKTLPPTWLQHWITHLRCMY
jgi:hypothetical protein